MIKKIYFALENATEWVDSSTLGLFPTRWHFPDPDVKTVLVDIPGRSGVIDLTETLTGDAAFSNVSGEVAFRVIDSSLFDFAEFRRNYHGMRVKMRTDTDLNYYRVGRVTIIDDDRQDVLRGFTVAMDADPYAYAIAEKTQTVPVPVAKDKFLSGTWVSSGVPKYVDYTPAVTTWNESENKVRDFEVVATRAIGTSVGATLSFAMQLPTISAEAGAYYMLMCDIEVTTADDISAAAQAYVEYGGEEHAVGTVFFATVAGDAVVKMRLRATNETGTRLKTCEVTIKNVYLYKVGAAAQAEIENGGRMPIVPTINSTVNAVASVGGRLVQIEQGVQKKMFGLELKKGDTPLVLFQLSGESAGSATVKFREGDLR